MILTVVILFSISLQFLLTCCAHGEQSATSVVEHIPLPHVNCSQTKYLRANYACIGESFSNQTIASI